MELILTEIEKPFMCLNMIVKNESHIIKDTLTKLLNKIKIDYWIISDTGSTDNTKQIINDFFEEKKIPGQLFQDEWKDFGYNRSKALEHAYSKSKYLLIFDADDEICGNFVLPELTKDLYNFQFGDKNGISYTRPQIINNKKKWKYVGVLHEAIVCCEKMDESDTITGNYYTISGKSGARSQDPNKYLNDALILEKAYENAFINKDDIYNRYGFYCANSYYDCGKYDDAIKWYKKTLNNNNWVQEKYISCLRLFHCYNALKQKETGFFYLVESFLYDKERVECLYELVLHYCCNNLNDVAHCYYQVVKQFYNEKYLNCGLTDKLFLEVSKADFYLPYYMIIVCYSIKDYDTAIQMYRIIFTKKYKETNKTFIGNMLFNLQFYIEHANNDLDFLNLFKEYISFLKSINVSVNEYDFMEKYEKYGIVIDKKCISKNKIDKNNKYETSNKILVYTGWMTHLWNESHLDQKALGGAEKAVAYLTRELPKNYEIIVSGDVEDGVFDNVTYIHQNKLQDLLDKTVFHTIIVSRYVCFFEQFKNSKCYKLIVSAHDSTGFINTASLPINNILKNNYSDIDNIISLTPWHTENIIRVHPFLNKKIISINNGIHIENFPKNNIRKVKNKFIWSSCAYRGLHIILELWKEIVDKIPDATLDICSYNAFPENEHEKKMENIINSFDSIRHHGKLNSIELYDLMAKTEFWLYTNTFPETSCITGMEMLMSEVICIYYPLAGLNDTVGKYGIPVNQGEEIDTILNLSSDKKALMREAGKEYALSCSWKNRAEEWSSMLGIGEDNNRIGIFNSFPFHYEMFGFILNYAQNNNIEVDIFTNKQNNMGWLDFYKESFSNFNIIDFNNFNGNTNKYSTFFVTTDDDPLFKSEWRTDNVICINHYYKIRTPNFKHYLNVANFKDSLLDYSYPCYPLINYQDKIQNTTVCIIGGGFGLNFSILKRLQSNNKIKLNMFVGNTDKINTDAMNVLDNNIFDIHFKIAIDTTEMINELNKSSYILINYNYNHDMINGNSCSGSIQLALSTLCKPIMAKTSNKYLQIENALEFDIDSDEPINIDDEIDFQLLEEERNKYVDDFGNYLTTIFKKDGIALIVEPRKLEKIDKIITHVYNKLNNNSKYNWKILFYCGKGLKTYYLSLFHDIEINIIEIDANNFTLMEYNDLLKSLSLWNNINSEYTLVFQADCYIFNNPPYTIDYFIDKNYTYIGGNMSYEWKELKNHNFNPQYRNFNGGLSLRKTKDMIHVIQSFQPQPSIEKIDKFETYGEDVYFTIGAYKLNLRVGNTKDDQHFSCHSIITDKCFGIHNSDLFLDKNHLLKIYPEIYNQPYIISNNVKKELVNKNIYINNDGWKNIENDNIIFMETNKIDKVFLSNKKTPFVLVTANNLDYPSGYNDDIEILNNPYLIKWFGTFPAISHPKFLPLPLGPKAYWKKTDFFSEYVDTTNYNIISENINPLVNNRAHLLYCNFSNTTSNPYIKQHKGCRIKLWEILKNINIPIVNIKNQKDYLADLSTYIYCVCPPGNGCDSHRIWEALMMNCIPVVIKYEPFLELYKKLPILVLEKWEDLTTELLNSKKEYFAKFIFNRELIYKKYYIDKIINEVEPINRLHSLQNKLKITGGHFSEELVEQIIATKYINENDKVLEIGGNIGRNSMIIASLLNKPENLTVLETDPKSFEILKHNKEINNLNFKVINAGLSNYKLMQNSWDTYYDDSYENKDNFFQVNNITYKDLIKITGTDYNVLVLDCEGAFYYILKEFPEIIVNINKILIENDYKTVEEKKYVDDILFNNNFVSVFQDYHPDKWGPFYNKFYEVYKK